MEKRTPTDRIYEDFEPSTGWQQDAAFDIFIVNLPGFRKEQLKVQVTTSRMLRVRGERPKEGDKWSRFCLEVPVASRYNIDEISAKFENNILYIKHPKVNSRAAVEAPKPPKTETENSKAQIKGQEQQQATQTGPSVEKQQIQKPKQDLQALMKNGEEKGTEELHPSTKNDGESVPGKGLERKNEELGGATTEAKNEVGEKREKEEVAAENSTMRDKYRVVEDSKKGSRADVKEMKHSRKIMNLVVAILFVLVAVFYARDLVRLNRKSQD